MPYQEVPAGKCRGLFVVRASPADFPALGLSLSRGRTCSTLSESLWWCSSQYACAGRTAQVTRCTGARTLIARAATPKDRRASIDVGSVAATRRQQRLARPHANVLQRRPRDAASAIATTTP